jgi:hypothetical protein
MGVGAGGGSAVFGQVHCIHIRDDIYVKREALKPIGRIAGTGYARITDTFDMVR